MADDVRRLGAAEVTYVGRLTNVPGTDFDGQNGGNFAHRFKISLPTKPAIVADWINWKRLDGLSDVRVQWLEGREAEGCPRHYHRLGVYVHPEHDVDDERRVMMLRLVGPKNGKPDQTTLRKASLEEIGEAAGIPAVVQTLLDWGAGRVGRRDELGWPALRKDAFQAVSFSGHALWVPMAGLLLCVVLPLARRRG